MVLWDNGEVGDANDSGVVHLDERAWLRGLMGGDYFLGCGVESAEFSFGSRSHDKLHYLGD